MLEVCKQSIYFHRVNFIPSPLLFSGSNLTSLILFTVAELICLQNLWTLQVWGPFALGLLPVTIESLSVCFHPK